MWSLQHEDVLHQMLPLLHFLEDSDDVAEANDAFWALLVQVCLRDHAVRDNRSSQVAPHPNDGIGNNSTTIFINFV